MSSYTNGTPKLGTLVWDTIAELSHRGEETLGPDSSQCAELRKAAYVAAGDKGNDRRLAFTTLEWLQGMATFDAVRNASEAYEKARIKGLGQETPSLNAGCNSGSRRTR